MNVLVISEDPINDQYMLRPIIKAMFENLERKQVKVVVSQDRLGGFSGVLNPGRIAQVVTANPMVDLFLACIDRDCTDGREASLNYIEMHVRENHLRTSGKRQFFGQLAWEEIEVWVMAGVDYSEEYPNWTWSEIRADRDVKDHYYEPYATRRNLKHSAGSGREILGLEAAKKYRTILGKCQGDLGNLQRRVRDWLALR